ncbi:MAG: ATP-binding protein [Spirochaetes bacterium]|nr:ATP-binding protein [Spirochaetota bacterium]
MRYLEPLIETDLLKKMVFLGGPRQCGKTTLANSLLARTPGRYLNWDFDEDRNEILKKRWGPKDKLLVFDELHKFPRWKNWIKGNFDKEQKLHQFLVTGSARLDVYRRGGDSLLGRYHYWRLHPFTLSEIPKGVSPKSALVRLMTVGGFPEPFLDNNENEARRWRKDRYDRVLRDDVRDLEPIKDIQTLSLLVDLLRRRVGSPVVVSNLAGDLQVAPQTVKHWLEILERMYLIFIVQPYSKNLPRALLKPPKIFFFDNGDVIGDEGTRFENLVAAHLLKKIQFLEDSQGYRYELRYVRDKEGHEVDFVILKDGVVDELVEAKYGDDEISRSLKYFAERLKPRRARQVVFNLKREYSSGKLSVENPFTALSSFNIM